MANEISQLVARADAFLELSGRKESGVSTALFNDGKRLGQLRRQLETGDARMFSQTVSAANAKLDELERRHAEKIARAARKTARA